MVDVGQIKELGLVLLFGLGQLLCWELCRAIAESAPLAKVEVQ